MEYIYLFKKKKSNKMKKEQNPLGIFDFAT